MRLSARYTNVEKLLAHRWRFDVTQLLCSLSSTGRSCVSCCPRPCSHPKHSNLTELADDYVRVNRPKLACSLRWFGDVSSIEESIERSALSRVCYGKVHPHQSRWITEQARCQANELLQERLTDIGAASSFESLMSIVEEIAGAVSGIGDLKTYDIALRIGQFKDLNPEKVYLHAGARVGATALGIRVGRVAPITSFPPELQRLEPREIEDFLCVHKHCLAELPEGSNGRAA